MDSAEGVWWVMFVSSAWTTVAYWAPQLCERSRQHRSGSRQGTGLPRDLLRRPALARTGGRIGPRREHERQVELVEEEAAKDRIEADLRHPPQEELGVGLLGALEPIDPHPRVVGDLVQARAFRPRREYGEPRLKPFGIL